MTVKQYNYDYYTKIQHYSSLKWTFLIKDSIPYTPKENSKWIRWGFGYSEVFTLWRFFFLSDEGRKLSHAQAQLTRESHLEMKPFSDLNKWILDTYRSSETSNHPLLAWLFTDRCRFFHLEKKGHSPMISYCIVAWQQLS